MMQNGDPVLIRGAWFSGEWDSKDGDDPRVMVKTRYGTTFILHAHDVVPLHLVKALVRSLRNDPPWPVYNAFLAALIDEVPWLAEEEEK